MFAIKWDESNSVGNKQMDDQHKVWVDIYNRLDKQMRLPTQQSESDFQLVLLKELVDFSKKHFTREEELMQQHNYPNYSLHRRMHKNYHQRIYELYREVLAGEMVLNSELMSMISSWFMGHTSVDDKKAFLHINSAKNHSE